MIDAKITGWKVGAKTISAISEIMNAAGVGLAESKDRIERVLSGETVAVEIADRGEAERFASAMKGHGFIVEIG